jgi:hypothetical protein
MVPPIMIVLALKMSSHVPCARKGDVNKVVKDGKIEFTNYFPIKHKKDK